MMKALAIGSLLAIALAGNASAADLAVKAPVYKAPAVHLFSWTGCYVGGHVGGMKNDSEIGAYGNPPLTGAQILDSTHFYNLDNSAGTAGVQYGCNRQYGNMVIGLDSSISWSGLEETVVATHPATPNLQQYTEALSQELTYYTTTRARLGWAQDRWLLFVAGGLATGRVEANYASIFSGGAIFAGSESKTRYGWTAGGGFAYAFNDNWWLRGEYLYVDLGSYDYIVPQTNGALTFTSEVDTRFHVARVGLEYRFTRAGSLLEWALGGFKY